MNVPNLFSLLQQVASKHDLSDNSVKNCASIVHDFVEAAREIDSNFAYISKIPGEANYGNRSQDSAAYDQGNPVSVKLISGAGDAGHGVQLVWVVGGSLRSTDHWLYPDSASFAAPAPVQDPPAQQPSVQQPPAVSSGDVDRIVDAINGARDAIVAKLADIENHVEASVNDVKKALPEIAAALGGGTALASLFGKKS